MAYRNPITGIYSITHVDSGRVYIGSATNIQSRWGYHRASFRTGKNCSPYLKNAWDKYGEAAFKFDIIEIVPDKNDLLKREQYWIDYYDAANREKGFNISPTAGSPLGTKRSPEAIEKSAQKIRGQKRSDEFRQKASAWMKGNRNGAGHSWCGVLAETDILPIFVAVADGEPIAYVAKRYSVDTMTIRRVIRRKTWANTSIHKETVRKAQENERNYHKTSPHNKKNGAKLTREEVVEIKRQLAQGVSPTEIAQNYDTTRDNIYAIRKGKSWKDVT